jgi:hypothetical protein
MIYQTRSLRTITLLRVISLHLFLFASLITAQCPTTAPTPAKCKPNTPKPAGPPQCLQFFPDLKDKFKNWRCPGPTSDDKLKMLNDLERDFCGGPCLGYATCNLISALQCNTVADAKDAADSEQTDFCKKYMPGGACVHNAENDAFHHCYWNARMTLDGDAGIATHFGQMHECGANRTDEFNMTLIQPDIELNMDLHNNAIGRTIGEKARGMSSDSQLSYIRNQCTTLALNGGLWVIDPQKLIPNHQPNFPCPGPFPGLTQW